jgi:DNA-binding NarL/FixJ family response regulator
LGIPYSWDKINLLVAQKQLVSLDNATMNIALVEDDKQTRERLHALITSGLPQARVTGFGRLNSALLHAQAQNEDYWLIDLGLPDGSGIDLIRSVRNLQPTAHILVISVFGDVDNIVGSIKAGASGYLLKDAAQQDLMGALEAMELGGTPLSPMIASRLLETLAITHSNTAQSSLLTGKERELLNLLSRGYSYIEAAQLQGVARSTVQSHVKSIYGKLAVNSKAEAIYEAKVLGLL